MKIKFKNNAKAYNGTEDFWYALFEGGYINPDNLISDKNQILEIRDAMKILSSFKSQMEAEGLYDPS